MAHKRKLRNYFIKKDFQGKITLAIFIAVVVCCFIFIVMFGLFSADSMTISYENNELLMGKTPAMLFKNALAANLFFLVICGSVLVFAALIGTHRIAGPIFRLEKALDSMIKRNLSDTIYLRGKDEGKDLAAKINTFNNLLSDDLRGVQKHSRAISDLINRYSSNDSSSYSLEDIDSICRAIKKNNGKIQELLTSYHFADDE